MWNDTAAWSANAESRAISRASKRRPLRAPTASAPSTRSCAMSGMAMTARYSVPSSRARTSGGYATSGCCRISSATIVCRRPTASATTPAPGGSTRVHGKAMPVCVETATARASSFVDSNPYTAAEAVPSSRIFTPSAMRCATRHSSIVSASTRATSVSSSASRLRRSLSRKRRAFSIATAARSHSSSASARSRTSYAARPADRTKVIAPVVRPRTRIGTCISEAAPSRCSATRCCASFATLRR